WVRTQESGIDVFDQPSSNGGAVSHPQLPSRNRFARSKVEEPVQFGQSRPAAPPSPGGEVSHKIGALRRHIASPEPGAPRSIIGDEIESRSRRQRSGRRKQEHRRRARLVDVLDLSRGLGKENRRVNGTEGEQITAATPDHWTRGKRVTNFPS